MADAGAHTISGADRFFRILHRVNAVMIFGLVVFGFFMLIQDWSRSSGLGAGGAFGDSGYGDEGSYVGRDIETVDGAIIAYEANEELGFQPERGANVSLTNMETGQSVTIAPEESSVVAWHVLDDDEVEMGSPRALGYVAFVADDEQFETGRFDLVVGRFADLTPKTVAENILYGDLPTVHGDQSVAIIVWAEEDQAEFVSIDLATGEIFQRRAVDLPRVEDNALSFRDPQRIGPNRKRLRGVDSEFMPAPTAQFH